MTTLIIDLLQLWGGHQIPLPYSSFVYTHRKALITLELYMEHILSCERLASASLCRLDILCWQLTFTYTCKASCAQARAESTMSWSCCISIVGMINNYDDQQNYTICVVCMPILSVFYAEFYRFIVLTNQVPIDLQIWRFLCPQQWQWHWYFIC